MDAILEIVLRNPPLLYVPAVGAFLALVLLRVKKRYVNEGYFLRRPPVSARDHHSSFAEESNMTTPSERTRAVIETRRFLEMLASDDGFTDPKKIREAAIGLLRHYPLDVDIDISAAALPGVWAPLAR